MFRTLSFSLLAALGGLCLGSCSQHESPSTGQAGQPGQDPVAATAKPRTTGTQVDSLNGVPGHRFGEPLSAFTGLVKSDGPATEVVSYYYPTGSPQELPWFAKHAADVPGVFYQFRDGKFSGFRAIAYSPAGQAALTQEATFLFGAGRTVLDRTEWGGEQAWALLQGSAVNGRPAKILDVNSRGLQAKQTQDAQAQLKKDNSWQ